MILQYFIWPSDQTADIFNWQYLILKGRSDTYTELKVKDIGQGIKQ